MANLTQAYPPAAPRTIVDAPGRSTAEIAATTMPGRITVLPRVQRDPTRELQLVPDERQRYEDTAVLGEGGAGVVHRTSDNDIGRVVARKRIRRSVAGPEGVARFVDEIRLVGQLEHPNIIPIHDVGVDEAGEYFFVMKHVEGETLDVVIARLAAGDPVYHGRYPMERRVEIFLGILEAIHYAHGRRILHRDIKPSNVMVGSSGEVMVMDWGIARTFDDTTAPAGEIVGTPLYMSPEQAAGEAVDERSDVYSLGVLFDELLTLRHYLAGARAPVSGDDQTGVVGDDESLALGKGVQAVLTGVITVEAGFASVVPNRYQTPVPAELAWFLNATLKKDKSKRLQTVGAMIERLRARNDGRFPIQCPNTLMKRSNREFLRFFDHHPIFAPILVYGAFLGLIALLVVRLFFH